jgi:hypothetical protein
VLGGDLDVPETKEGVFKSFALGLLCLMVLFYPPVFAGCLHLKKKKFKNRFEKLKPVERDIKHNASRKNKRRSIQD